MDELEKAITEAYLFFDQDLPEELDLLMISLLDNLKGKPIKNTIEAIKDGTMGKFGYFHKLNFHIIALWINCGLNDTKPGSIRYKNEKL